MPTGIYGKPAQGQAALPPVVPVHEAPGLHRIGRDPQCEPWDFGIEVLDARRYFEDIDLVQVRPEPIGYTVDALRQALSWLGPLGRAAAKQPVIQFTWFSDSLPRRLRPPPPS